MKEILVFGDGMDKHFDRLEIRATKTYSGHGWSDKEILEVYELADEDFKVLCDDLDDNWEDSECCWRSAESSNMVAPLKRFKINGHYLKAWFEEESRIYGSEWDFLLRYFCDAVGASQPRNVTALAVHLAQINGLTLGQLMEKYQGRRKVT